MAAIIRKDKSTGNWYFRLRVLVDGKYKEIRKRGFSTKREAEIAAIELEFTHLNESHNISNQKPVAATCVTDNNSIENVFTVRELYEEYIAYISTRLKSGNVRSASDVIRLYVLPYFQDRPIDSLTTVDIRNWQTEIEKKGFRFKYKSKIYCGFTALMNYGVKFHELKENVVSRVGNFKNNEPRSEMRFWTEEEFLKVYAVIDDKLYAAFFSFLYLMGTRKGEALALTWRDVDFIREEVRINKSLNRKQPSQGLKGESSPSPVTDMGWHISKSRSYEITTPKNKASYRNVIMPKNLIKLMLDHLDICKKHPDFSMDSFVFGVDEPLSDQTIRRRLDEYADKAGVKRIRVHDIRHSHASLLINKGQNILIVSQRLGHSDVTQTLNTYASKSKA